MNYNEAITYLLRCSDDNGNHWYEGRVWSDPDTCPNCKGADYDDSRCPGSRYGFSALDNARVAYECAKIEGNVSEATLDLYMGLAVNDSDEPDRLIREYRVGLSGANIEEMVRGYLECQLWAQFDYERNGEDGTADYCLDANYDTSDVSAEYIEVLTDELSGIVTAHPLAVRMYLAQRNPSHGTPSEYFGHDFYLTREGHGCGFWDRGLGELGDYLTKIAKSWGSASDIWNNGQGVLVSDCR